MRSLIVIAAIVAAMVCAAQRTTRQQLHPRAEAATATAEVKPPYDTVVAPGADRVEVKGYDKPLRSRRETFFATNTGDMPVRRIAFTISYYDLDKHLMHRASHNVEADIPAGETRMVGVRSWDVQQAFYYTRTQVGAKNPKGTPYDVEIAVDTLFVGRP